MMDYNDYRKGRSYGTSTTADIKCKSFNETLKIRNALIYPTPGDEIRYYSARLGCYCWGTVVKYKSGLTLILKPDVESEIEFTLRKDGYFYQKRDKVLYNVFDIKYMKPLKIEC